MCQTPLSGDSRPIHSLPIPDTIEKIPDCQNIYTLESLKLQQMNITTNDTIGLSIYSTFQNSIVAFIPTHREHGCVAEQSGRGPVLFASRCLLRLSIIEKVYLLL